MKSQTLPTYDALRAENANTWRAHAIMVKDLTEAKADKAALLSALKDTAATLAALSAKHRDGMDNLVGTTLYNARAVIAEIERKNP